MMNGVKPAQENGGPWWRWPAEVKLAALQGWRSGLPMEEVGQQVPEWIMHYNQEASHRALGMQTPAELYAVCRLKNQSLPVQA